MKEETISAAVSSAALSTALGGKRRGVGSRERRSLRRQEFERETRATAPPPARALVFLVVKRRGALAGTR